MEGQGLAKIIFVAVVDRDWSSGSGLNWQFGLADFCAVAPQAAIERQRRAAEAAWILTHKEPRKRPRAEGDTVPGAYNP